MLDAIVAFLQEWSPLDVVLIAQNFDRFLWGALITLQLTLLSLVIGGLLSIPLAIIRAGNNPFAVHRCWCKPTLFTMASGNLNGFVKPCCGNRCCRRPGGVR